MKTYDFKEMIEMAMDDDLNSGVRIRNIREIIDAMEVDDLLVHEDDWVGPKPGKDIELFGEHWFKDYWTPEDGDPMEGFESVL
jgi:hypothetical protein